jgi:signal transduction histidine kinase
MWWKDWWPEESRWRGRKKEAFMSVIRGMVEALNGSIDAESSVGVGTTLRIILPMTRAY